MKKTMWEIVKDMINGKNGSNSGNDEKRISQMSEVVVEKTVNKAQLGTWISHRYDLQSTVSCLGPYIKSDEDILAVLNNYSLLDPDQPVELCGISLDRILDRAASMEISMEPESKVIDYSEFAKTRPIVVTFPSETIRLARDHAVSRFGASFEEIMRTVHHDWEDDRLKALSTKMQGLIKSTRKTYNFWKEITRHQEDGIVYSRHLIDWTIASAQRARAKYMAGLTPMVDCRAPGSLSLSDKFNRVHLHVLRESSRSSVTPHYLYTINLSSTSIRRKSHDFLKKVLRTTRFEMETREFDGIYLAVRKLGPIYNDPARVATTVKFVGDLAEIAKDFRLPLCWSRANLAGLRGLDQGVTTSTFSLNLNVDDMFLDGGPSGEDAEEYHFGYVMNPWTGEDLKRENVKTSIAGPAMGMPEIGGVPNSPTQEQLDHNYLYRTGFSKPYNLRVMTLLSKKWQEEIRADEKEPGASYLGNLNKKSKWKNWGL